MKTLLFSICIIVSNLAGVANAQSNSTLITRAELFEVALAGDVDGLEAIFSGAHRAFGENKLSADDLRALNTMLIVTHPGILEVTEKWVEAYPNSIYAKSVRSFQISNMAWRIRGAEYARDTYPEALRLFDEFNERAFELAYDAFQSAPGYVPASDAVIMLNQTMHVFWGHEIESIIEDTMAQTPNFGTLARAAKMHWPQWGGEGPSGVRRHCNRFVPLMPKLDGFTPETCAAILIFGQPFSQEDRFAAASQLVNVDIEGFESTSVKVILELKIEERHQEVYDALASDQAFGGGAYNLLKSYIHWKGTEEAYLLQDTVMDRMVQHAKEQLVYDPYNVGFIKTIAVYDNRSGQIPPDHRVRSLDQAARRVGGQPFASNAWAGLADQVLHEFGFEESRAYQSNAMVYGLHKENVTFGYLSRIHIFWRNKVRARELNLISADDFNEIEEQLICETVRLQRLTEELCSYDPYFYAQSCNPFKTIPSRRDPQVDEVAQLLSRADTGTFACDEWQDAGLDQLIYQPVDADIKRFIIDPRQ